MKKLAFAFVFFSSLHATAQCLLKEVSLTQRTTSSELIIEGRVTDKHSFWNDDHSMIYTRNTVEVFKIFKGSLMATAIDVLTEGGIVGLDMIKAEPALGLNKDETGIFLCENAKRFMGLKAVGTTLPIFETYASVQGFIRYNLQTGTASDPFKTYSHVETDLYRSFSPSLNYRVLKPFTLTTPPSSQRTQAITGFSPASVTAGTGAVLTINGSGFGATRGSGTVSFKNADDGGASYINPLPSQYLSWNDNQITVQVPSAAGTGTVQVTQGTTYTTASPLTVNYTHTNLEYDLGSGVKEWQTKHANDNGSGGYTWQINTAFDAATGAKASFLRAFNTWRCNTGVNWTIGSTTSVANVAADGTNVICFDNTAPLAAGILGTCYSYYSGCIPNGSTVIWWVTELDIIFDEGSNISPLSWQYGPTTPSISQYDFETVAVHELGHGQQLGHVISAGAIMHYAISNGSSNRLLSANDLAGGQFVQAKSVLTDVCGPVAATAFGSCGTLPITVSSLNAYKEGSGIQVEWTNLSESNVDHYELEESGNGTAFTTGALFYPKANNGQAASYQWLDQHLSRSKNYYRVKSVGNNGETKYTDIALVNIDRANETLVVYPNPVKGKILHIELNNLERGSYQLLLYNAAGQQAAKTVVQYDSNAKTIVLPVVAAGIYRLVLQGEGVLKQQNVVVGL